MNESTLATCRICATRGKHPIFIAREAMFATGEQFRYFQCEACQTLQIERIPEDLGAYYPASYYSQGVASRNPITTQLLRCRDEYAFSGRGMVGHLLHWLRPGRFPFFRRYCRGLDKNSRVLDVGCGDAAELLRSMDLLGFRNLLGVDPYLSKQQIRISPNLALQRSFPAQKEGPFDLIMLNHSLEHIRDPMTLLSQLRGLLDPHGKLIVRIPVLGYAWRHYGVNWVQLDAPRHLHLFSRKAIETAARITGFELERCIYESGSWQFSGSEQLAQGKPMLPSLAVPRSLLKQFEREARRLNAAEDGDQAGFVFRALAT